MKPVMTRIARRGSMATCGDVAPKMGKTARRERVSRRRKEKKGEGRTLKDDEGEEVNVCDAAELLRQVLQRRKK